MVSVSEKTNQRFTEFQLQMEEQFLTCTTRWEKTDNRIQKCEKSITQLDDNVNNHQVALSELSDRSAYLEREVMTLRSDLNRIATQKHSCNADLTSNFDPVFRSSTAIPAAVSLDNTSSNTKPNIPFPNSLMHHNLSNSGGLFFGAQERLQDAVSEFNGNIKKLHPEKFLAQLDSYFHNVSLTPGQQLISAQRRLSGEASILFESLYPSPKTFTEFQEAFRRHFWSPVFQRKMRHDLFRPYRYDRSYGLASHAMQWISNAKYLTPPIEQLDLVSTILQHYPAPLSMAIRGRAPQSTNELLTILSEFEESASFCDSQQSEDRPQRPLVQNPSSNDRGGRSNYRRDYRGNNRFPPNTSPPAEAVGQPIHQFDVSGNAEVPRA